MKPITQEWLNRARDDLDVVSEIIDIAYLTNIMHKKSNWRTRNNNFMENKFISQAGFTDQYLVEHGYLGDRIIGSEVVLEQCRDFSGSHHLNGLVFYQKARNMIVNFKNQMDDNL